jgi:SAM-dependent methyltransferase
MSSTPFPLIDSETFDRAARLALWRGFWSPGGLELTHSVAAAMDLPTGAAVLDAGAGSGESSVHLVEHFGWQVTALDNDEFGLAMARDKAKQPGLKLQTVHADLLSLPFSEAQFDGIFCQGTFFMLGAERPQALQEWSRVLKPSGVIGIGEPTLTQPGLSRHSPQQVTLTETVAWMEQAGLTVEMSAMHPYGTRLWEEFHGPHHDKTGQIRRQELAGLVQAWREESDLLGLGVLVARKARDS